MRMRGILVALACAAVMGGCGCGETGLEGEPDGSLDPGTESTHDPASDTVDEEAVISRCGDGVVDSGEECDDANADDCDGCTARCNHARALATGSTSPGARLPSDSIVCIRCPFTIEAWFKLDEESSVLGVVHGREMITFSASTGSWSYQCQGLGGTGTWPDDTALVPGTWHHVAAVCEEEEYGHGWSFHHWIDGTGFYLDGGSSADREPCALIEFALKSEPHIPGGAVDDVRISSAALYRGGGDGFTPDRYLSVDRHTVAFWDFDLEFDGVIPDVSGNGHDAVLVEGTLVPDDCHLP